MMEIAIQPSELTWSTEMAVADLDEFQENRLCGRGRAGFIGDSAHDLFATGVGGLLDL